VIQPISTNVNNNSVYYGAQLASDKSSAPKTDVTNSSASASARGDYRTAKTGVTRSSSKEPAQTIAPATASRSISSEKISAALNADSEKEFIKAKTEQTQETPALKAKDALKIIASQERNSSTIITMKSAVNAEAVISAYKK